MVKKSKRFEVGSKKERDKLPQSNFCELVLSLIGILLAMDGVPGFGKTQCKCASSKARYRYSSSLRSSHFVIQSTAINNPVAKKMTLRSFYNLDLLNCAYTNCLNCTQNKLLQQHNKLLHSSKSTMGKARN